MRSFCAFSCLPGVFLPLGTFVTYCYLLSRLVAKGGNECCVSLDDESGLLNLAGTTALVLRCLFACDLRFY